jgi:GNAT superfamily N-acetyltransferase
MNIEQEWQLAPDIKACRVDRLPDDTYLEQINQYLLAPHPSLPWQRDLDDHRKQQLRQLRERVKQRYELRIALLHHEILIGWTYGWQDGNHTCDFYMAASLVLPAYRQRGLYRKMVEIVIQETKQQGFSTIRSRHIMTNNAVLIAKLKLGFIINGLEQDDSLGSLLRMVYHHDELRQQAQAFRSGVISHTNVLQALLSTQQP